MALDGSGEPNQVLECRGRSPLRPAVRPPPICTDLFACGSRSNRALQVDTSLGQTLTAVAGHNYSALSGDCSELFGLERRVVPACTLYDDLRASHGCSPGDVALFIDTNQAATSHLWAA